MLKTFFQGCEKCSRGGFDPPFPMVTDLTTTLPVSVLYPE